MYNGIANNYMFFRPQMALETENVKVLYQSVDKELELNQVIPQFTLNNVCGKSNQNQFINKTKSQKTNNTKSA